MFLVVAGAIVAVVLVSTSDSRNASGSDIQIFPPTAAPTIDPRVAANMDSILATLSTMQDVLNLLNQETNNTSSEDDVVDGGLDPSSIQTDPRILARNWMLHEDLLRDELLASDNTQAILQRFVLVEFYYSTHGDVSWTPFQEAMREDNSTTTPFLTPEATECLWEGIDCEENEDTFFYVRTIHLENRNLTGTLPDSLYTLRELGEISLLHNALTGPLPDLWFSNDTTHMPALFKLDLENNQLTGMIPSNLWSHGNMRFVYLDSNQFTGSVFNGRADKVSRFLEEVWIQNNTLTGPLPSWLFGHELLTVFWADDNTFSGSLPNPIFFPSLKWITVSSNNLTGPLLAGHLEGPSLETIGLHDNQLSGPLPELGKGTSPLINVLLHNNSFSGNIPINFGLTWSQLVNLYLTGNPELKGSITMDQCQVWNTRESPVENVQVDCPPIVCLGSCCSNDACYDT